MISDPAIVVSPSPANLMDRPIIPVAELFKGALKEPKGLKRHLQTESERGRE